MEEWNTTDCEKKWEIIFNHSIYIVYLLKQTVIFGVILLSKIERMKTFFNRIDTEYNIQPLL